MTRNRLGPLWPRITTGMVVRADSASPMGRPYGAAPEQAGLIAGAAPDRAGLVDGAAPERAGLVDAPRRVGPSARTSR